VALLLTHVCLQRFKGVFILIISCHLTSFHLNREATQFAMAATNQNELGRALSCLTGRSQRVTAELGRFTVQMECNQMR